MEILVNMPNTDNHVCKYPQGYQYIGRDRSQYGINSIAQCTCGKKYVLVYSTVPDNYAWTRLRWYHFKARKALKNV